MSGVFTEESARVRAGGDRGEGCDILLLPHAGKEGVKMFAYMNVYLCGVPLEIACLVSIDFCRPPQVICPYIGKWVSVVAVHIHRQILVSPSSSSLLHTRMLKLNSRLKFVSACLEDAPR